MIPAEAPSPELSYASYFEDPVKRRLVRVVERFSGQPRLKKLYQHYREHLANDVPFFEAAIRLLDLEDKTYLRDDEPIRVRQCVVQDPDGYLLRFSELL